MNLDFFQNPGKFFRGNLHTHSTRSDGKLEKATPPLTLKRLLQLAPAERLQDLREGMARDALADAAAIRAWRP